MSDIDALSTPIQPNKPQPKSSSPDLLEKHVSDKDFGDNIDENTLKNIHINDEDNLQSDESKNKKADESKTQLEKVGDFIQEKIIRNSVKLSLLGFVSALLRLTKQSDKLQSVTKAVNNFNLFIRKAHFVASGTSLLTSGLKLKDPLLLAASLVDICAPLFKLGGIYLFRGFTTALDSTSFGVSEGSKKSSFKSFISAFKYQSKFVKETLVGLGHKIVDDPSYALFNKMNTQEKAFTSAAFVALGSVIGLGGKEKLGGTIRDTFGAMNDFAILEGEGKAAKTSGAFYLLGSAADLVGRLCAGDTSTILGIKNTDLLKRIKDALHEVALTFDCIGQGFFTEYMKSKK